MQSDVPPLPIAFLINKIFPYRNRINKSVEQQKKQIINEATCKSIKPSLSVTNRRRKPSPVIASPYNSVTRFNHPEIVKSVANKNAIKQRVTSAKMLRVKQLQNQLADAHFHLNELSNENKLLKAIHKRQDAALKRYEGTKAELPRIINTHQEDYRVLQLKCKKLRTQYNDANDALKDKDNELRALQSQNKKLLQLSKDRNLLEREKLQIQVFDMNHRIEEQDEMIQTLKRKLTLETKYLKHQLHVEMVKHKETQKQLEQTQIKLKSLEVLKEQRDKRSYHASRVFFHKDVTNIRPSGLIPRKTSQSLTNLNENGIKSDNATRNYRRRRYENTKGHSLPALGDGTIKSTRFRSQSQDNPQRITTSENFNQRSTPISSSLVGLTIAPSSTLSSKSTISIRDSPIKESRSEDYNGDEDKSKNNNIVDAIRRNELPKLRDDDKSRHVDDYDSDEDDDDEKKCNDDKDYVNNQQSLASRSRLLHTRLISSAIEGTRTKNQESIVSRPRSFSKENMEHIEKMNENDYVTRYDRDSVVTVISRDVINQRSESEACDNSHSDVESEMEIPVAFNPDEDENGDDGKIRKSDIDKSEIERQQKLSTDYSSSTSASSSSHERCSSNSSSSDRRNSKRGDRENNDDNFKLGQNSEKIEIKTIDDINVYNEKLFANDINATINNAVTRKKSIAQEKSSFTNSSDDDYEKIVLEDDRLTSGKITTINLNNAGSNANVDKFENINPVEVKKSDSYFYDFKGEINYQANKSDAKNNGATKKISGNENNTKGFDKAKLLAAMKAIDNNENIEFIEQKPRKSAGSSATRSRVTENLYRGIPTHSKKKNDIMKELFSNVNINNKHGKAN